MERVFFSRVSRRNCIYARKEPQMASQLQIDPNLNKAIALYKSMQNYFRQHEQTVYSVEAKIIHKYSGPTEYKVVKKPFRLSDIDNINDRIFFDYDEAYERKLELDEHARHTEGYCRKEYWH